MSKLMISYMLRRILINYKKYAEFDASPAFSNLKIPAMAPLFWSVTENK
jgi:hypothetical protein